MKNAKYQVRLDKETVSLIIEKIYKAQEGLTLRCHATSEYNIVAPVYVQSVVF